MQDTHAKLKAKGYKSPVLLLHPLGGWTKVRGSGVENYSTTFTERVDKDKEERERRRRRREGWTKIRRKGKIEKDVYRVLNLFFCITVKERIK